MRRLAAIAAVAGWQVAFADPFPHRDLSVRGGIARTPYSDGVWDTGPMLDVELDQHVGSKLSYGAFATYSYHHVFTYGEFDMPDLTEREHFAGVGARGALIAGPVSFGAGLGLMVIRHRDNVTGVRYEPGPVLDLHLAIAFPLYEPHIVELFAAAVVPSGLELGVGVVF